MGRKASCWFMKEFQGKMLSLCQSELLDIKELFRKTPVYSQDKEHSGNRWLEEILHTTRTQHFTPASINTKIQLSGKRYCGLKTIMCAHVRVVWFNIHITKWSSNKIFDNSSFKHRTDLIFHTFYQFECRSLAKKRKSTSAKLNLMRAAGAKWQNGKDFASLFKRTKL